jgi:glycosyltransferase involved in cell wall biosynthesis
MASSTPAASVVVPCYDRPGSLEKTLKAICAQHSYVREVVVVDDGGPCSEAMEAVVVQYPIARYVYMEPQTEIWRAGMARNCGASLTSGDRIIFLDDDCAPRPGCLRAHATHGKEPVVVAGRIDMVADDNMGIRKDKRFLHGHYRDVAKNLKLHTYFKTQAYGAFWTGNMSVPAKEFKEVGGFWESIEGYGSEDQEVAWRLKEWGCQLMIDFRAVVYHFGKQHPQHKIDRRMTVIEESAKEPGLVRQGQFLPKTHNPLDSNEPRTPIATIRQTPIRKFDFS